MVRNGELDKDSGYHYKYDGADMVEYHMDIHIQFQENCNHLLYGENLLECKPPDAKLVNNQDKDYSNNSNLVAHHGPSWMDQRNYTPKMKNKASCCQHSVHMNSDLTFNFYLNQ